MKYSIIVPCYNEEGNIVNLVRTLNRTGGKYDIEYILVDNGSGDGTRKLLEQECNTKKRFKLVYVDSNKGYGYGLLQGLKLAEGDYVGWLHADLQVAPKEMMKCVKYVETHKDGQKYFIKGNRKGRRKYDTFFTSMMTIFETILFRCLLYDIGAVPVLFPRELLEKFDMPPYDFSMDLYAYWQARKAGLVIKRFPVMYEKRIKGESSWDKGLTSKFRQSKVIISDSIKIKKGKQIL